jgi:hypothetical protein
MSFMIHNQAVRQAFDVTVTAISIFVATSMAAAYETVVNFCNLCWNYLLPSVVTAMEVLDITAVDLLYTAFVLCVWVIVVYQTTKIFETIVITYGAFLQWYYGKELEPIFIQRPKPQLPQVKEIPSDFKPESAFANDDSFIYSLKKIPEGHFQIFCELDDQIVHAGHGFMVNNQPYTAYHVVAGRQFYLSVPGSKYLPATVKEAHPEYDCCLLDCPGVGAALGVKSLKWCAYTKTQSLCITLRMENSTVNM